MKRLGAAGFLFFQDVAANELRLFQRDKKADAGFDGRGVLIQLMAIKGVTHLGPQSIARTQARSQHDARRMLTHRKAAGDGNLEALRVPKRRLSDIVYKALHADTDLKTITTDI